jgi:hypothetical protein
MCKAHQTQKETPQPKREKMNWLLGRSTLSIESTLLLYKAVFKPILTFGIHLRSTASNSKSKFSSPLNQRLSDPF